MPVAVPPVSVAFASPVSVTVKVSSGSSTASPVVATVMVFSVSPGAKDSDPDFAVKSPVVAVSSVATDVA